MHKIFTLHCENISEMFPSVQKSFTKNYCNFVLSEILQNLPFSSETVSRITNQKTSESNRFSKLTGTCFLDFLNRNGTFFTAKTFS